LIISKVKLNIIGLYVGKKKEQMEYSDEGQGRTRLSKHRWSKHKSKSDGGEQRRRRRRVVQRCGVSEYYMLYYLSLIYWAQSRNNRDLVQIYASGFSYIHAMKVPLRL
jgi:hypothetical protein